VTIDAYEMQLEITNECLLNCKHCSSQSMLNHTKSGYVIADIIKFVRLFEKPVHLYLTGGEPLMQENITDIINKLSFENKNLLGIFTSGIVRHNFDFSSISEDQAKKLIESGLRSVYISVYHSESIFNDAITRVPNSLQFVISSIKNLISVGLDVKVHLVLNRYNIDSLGDIILMLSSMGVSEIRLLRIVKTGSAAINWNEIGVSYEKQNKVIYDIYQNKHDYGCSITLSGFPELVGCRPFINSSRCQAGIGLFYITLSGDVFPCACMQGCINNKIAHIEETSKLEEYVRNLKYIAHDKCLNPIM